MSGVGGVGHADLREDPAQTRGVIKSGPNTSGPKR